MLMKNLLTLPIICFVLKICIYFFYLSMLIAQLNSRINNSPPEPFFNNLSTFSLYFPYNRKRETIQKRIQTAQLLTQKPWQHWYNLLHQINASCTISSHPVNGTILSYKITNICNVHTNFISVLV